MAVTINPEGELKGEEGWVGGGRGRKEGRKWEHDAFASVMCAPSSHLICSRFTALSKKKSFVLEEMCHICALESSLCMHSALESTLMCDEEKAPENKFLWNKQSQLCSHIFATGKIGDRRLPG